MVSHWAESPLRRWTIRTCVVSQIETVEIPRYGSSVISLLIGALIGGCADHPTEPTDALPPAPAGVAVRPVHIGGQPERRSLHVLQGTHRRSVARRALRCHRQRRNRHRHAGRLLRCRRRVGREWCSATSPTPEAAGSRVSGSASPFRKNRRRSRSLPPARLGCCSAPTRDSRVGRSSTSRERRSPSRRSDAPPPRTGGRGRSCGAESSEPLS